MVRENIKILEEDIEKLSKEKITNSTAQMLSTYYTAKIALESVLNKNNEFILPQKEIVEYTTISNDGSTIQSMFPSFTTFQSNHNLHNLKKVLVETEEFLTFIYSGLKNEEEKYAYYDMIARIKE